MRKPKFFRRPANRPYARRKRPTIQSMERKIFWISLTVLGLVADFVLPLWWALGATIPIVFLLVDGVSQRLVRTSSKHGSALA
jgi:hypothetical protein